MNSRPPFAVPDFTSMPSDRTRLSCACLVLLTALAFVPCSHALEVVHFRNGDKITGDYLGREGNLLVFRSPLLGELRVVDTEAVIIELPETPVEALVGLPPMNDDRALSEFAPARPSSAISPPVPDAKPPAAAPAPPAAKPALARRTPWKGKIEFGFQQQGGRQNTLTASIRADANLKRGRNNYVATGRALYGKNTGRTNADRSDASFRWRRDYGDRVFTQSITSFVRDEIRGINQNWEQNVGVGYRLHENPRNTLNFGGGVTVQFRDSRGLEPGTFGLIEIFQDYTFKLNGRLTLLQNAVGQYSPDGQGTFTVVANQPVRTADGSENYKLRFNTTLQGKVSERISMNIRYEYEFDSAVFARDAESDQRITSSLAYAF